MNLNIRHFTELTTVELFNIYQLRTAVFVVEQNCPYQEVDDHDRHAYHVWLEEDGQILAYCRVIEAGRTFDEVSIGRVIAVKRGQGLGTKIVQAGLDVAQDKYQAESVHIEAQVYARKLYDNLGFIQCSEEFLEDGIPHIGMIWQKNQ